MRGGSGDTRIARGREARPSSAHPVWSPPPRQREQQDAIYERIVVTWRTIVSIRLTPSAYARGLAVALPTKVALAHPTGVGRALATYDIPIEGRDEWLAAAPRLA